MGSQNVTNFSTAKANRIRQKIEEFHPRSPQADLEAWFAAADAIGEFNKTNSFIQCLTSPSVEMALRSVISLATGFKYKNPESVLQGLGIDPDKKRPLGELGARLTKSVSENLSSTQQETKSSFAATDAIPRTIIDVVSEVVPREDVTAASPAQIADAFKKVPVREVSTILFRNVISSLLNMTLEAAAEGKVSRTTVNDLERRSREQFAAELSKGIDQLLRQKGIVPSDIPSFIRKNIEKKPALQKLEDVRVKHYPTTPAAVGGAGVGYRGIPKGKPKVTRPGKGKPRVVKKPIGSAVE